MASGPFEADLAAPFGVAAKGQGGAKLIRRRKFIGAPAPTGLKVDPEAGWVRIGVTGDGAPGTSGAGAAYAYNEGKVSAGQSITVPATNGALNGGLYTVTVGTVVCSAQSAATDGPGLAANCVGLYARSGGNNGASGQFGGTGFNSIGGPGGDGDKPDGIGIWGNVGNGVASGPGAGNAGPAAVVIELWSAKP